MFDQSLMFFVAIGLYKEIMGNQEIKGNIRFKFLRKF